jgi:dinuclear metal center YbgI/SA1388 family protein
MQKLSLQEIISVIEDFAPLSFQDSYDNSGLQVGYAESKIEGILITLDVTVDVIKEAIKKNCNLIISHHPITLKGIKSITGSTSTETIIIEAIKNDIAIYSAHTNLDSVKKGVSGKLAQKLNLINTEILEPRDQMLCKLITFVPTNDAVTVRNALFESGAGKIGNYSNCSFNSTGEGTFKASEDTNAYVGEKGKTHSEPEIKIETVFPAYLKKRIIKALKETHPYEEPAFDIIELSNEWREVGYGIIGELSIPLHPHEFLKHLKKSTNSDCIRYTETSNNLIKKIAVCGGSGSTLLKRAISAGADAFVTGDFKYHQFFESENKLMIADIGHYESEQFTKELFFEIVTNKFPNFAVRLSEVNSNPIKYY